LFLTVNLAEQLLSNTFEFTLDYLIHRLNLSPFAAAFHNDQTGAPAYPPNVMLKIIFSCYSKGILASRPIEQAYKNIGPHVSAYPGRRGVPAGGA
jgi:transposase